MLSLYKLDAYRVAMEFSKLVRGLVATLPRGLAEDADQLQRAAKSVIRNIAEGAGRWTRADKAKHYSIARGEAMECVASIDLLQNDGAIDGTVHDQAIELLGRLVSTLTGLIKKPM